MENEQEIVTQETTQVTGFDPFSEKSWSENPQVVTPEKKEETKVEVESAKPTDKPETTAVDYNQYLKDKFGFENEEAALTEIQKLKEQKANELKFENEASEKFFNLLKDGKEDDIYSFLTEKKKIEKLVNSQVDSVQTAEEIVKFSMQKKYDYLNEDEIEHKFKKLFAIPEKPTQGLEEADDEFEQKVANWETQKALAEKELIIEAKAAKTDLDKYKTSLVLPEVPKQQIANDNQPSEADLAAYQKAREVFEQSLESSYKTFEGIKVVAKNEEVELPISFSPTDAEKTELKEKLNGFDQAEYFGSRWLNQDGTVKIQQMMKDIYLLENAERAHQKIANEASAKTLEHYIKSRGNLHLNGERQPTPTFEKQGEDMGAFFFSQT